ncbi:hypothetical protein DFQ27_007572 [Actinomortierella ambigua]|uniref:Uncharacterized protein n=1 Tax=Actinomortierella ambigua TaxID=1343610 RepID=A0A9P6QLU2_9FUNG|nr:hypothetical protein DFQ27_007572 [Actinomortierella ambigua]
MSSHEHRKRSRSPEDHSRRDIDRDRDRDREKDASSSRHASSSSRHSSSSRGDHNSSAASTGQSSRQHHHDRSRSDRDDRDTRPSRSSGHRDPREKDKERTRADSRDRSSRHGRDRDRGREHDRDRDRDHRDKRSRRDKEQEPGRDTRSSDDDDGDDDGDGDGSSSSDDEDDEAEERERGKKGAEKKDKEQALPPQLNRKAISKGATAPISMDDYFLKSTEFRLWLRKVKKKYFDRLSSSRSHGYFRKFVKAWNNGDLDDTYYKGVRSSELASQGTKYKWGFVQKMGAKDQDELERTKDSIDSLTNSAKRFAEEMNTSSSASVSASKRFHDPTTAPSGSNALYSRRPNNADDVYAREEHDRQRRQTQRAQDRAYRKDREVDLEELVPKATGREALLEKRKAQTEYHRRERSPGVELSEQDMMGGGDDFRSAMAAERRARQQREGRQQMRREGGGSGGGVVLDARKQAYQEKEQGKIEALRQLWMQSQGSKRD